MDDDDDDDDDDDLSFSNMENVDLGRWGPENFPHHFRRVFAEPSNW